MCVVQIINYEYLHNLISPNIIIVIKSEVIYERKAQLNIK